MSSLGEHLRDATSASELKPKEEVATSVTRCLIYGLELQTRPETTVTTRIEGNNLEVKVVDPTAPEEIRVFGEFDPKGKKHQFSLEVGDRPAGLIQVAWQDFEGGRGLQSEVYLKKGGLFENPLSNSEFRTLVADALGAPAAAPHQVERVERPHLSSLDSVAPTTEPDTSGHGVDGPQSDASLHV